MTLRLTNPERYERHKERSRRIMREQRSQPKSDPRKAAERQAEAVMAYWRKLGKQVCAWPELVDTDDERQPVWGVRTDLVNGRPRA